MTYASRALVDPVHKLGGRCTRLATVVFGEILGEIGA
jgi:hypothetical protein